MHNLARLAFAAAVSLSSPGLIPASLAHEMKVGDLIIMHPWARQSPMHDGVLAGFMKITNTGKHDDLLIRATAEIAPNVQLHDMKMDGNAMKTIAHGGGIAIPAGQTVELKPMSLHIMFMGITEQPMANTEFKGTLVFERAGTIAVEYEVESPVTE